jgi:hypothetical protein
VVSEASGISLEATGALELEVCITFYYPRAWIWRGVAVAGKRVASSIASLMKSLKLYSSLAYHSSKLQ